MLFLDFCIRDCSNNLVMFWFFLVILFLGSNNKRKLFSELYSSFYFWTNKQISHPFHSNIHDSHNDSRIRIDSFSQNLKCILMFLLFESVFSWDQMTKSKVPTIQNPDHFVYECVNVSLL